MKRNWNMQPNPSEHKATVRLRIFLAIVGSSLLAISSAQASTNYWDGTSATWNDVANWSTDIGATTPDPLALPLVTDDLFFNINGANTVQNISLDAAHFAKSLTFNTTGVSNFRGNSSGTTARILTLGSGGITLAAGAGAVTIGESPATYGAVNITMGAAQTWKNASANLGLLSINGNVNNGGNLLTIGDSANNGSVSIGGVISGTGGITMTTRARLVLSGANEFTGAITLNGFTDHATLAFTSIANYGVASALGKAASGSISLGNVSSEGRLEYIGTTDRESNRTIEIKGTSTTAGQVYNNGTGTLKFTATTFNTANGTGAHYLILGGSNAGSNEIKGIISNGVTSGTAVLSLNKTGSGTWILSGNNTYGGNTAVSGGKLVLSGINSYTGTTTVSGMGELVLSGDTSSVAGATSVSGGGKLVLDYTTDYTNDSKIGYAALTLTGGSLVLRGGSHAQAVTVINFYANAYSSISREAGSTATLANAGAIQANGAGNTSSTLSISAGGIVTTTTGNAGGGILSNGKITIGSDFATNDGSNLVQAYSGYTTIAAGGAGDLLLTHQLSGGGAAAGSMSSYALKIVNSTASDVLTLGTGRDLLISNNGTVLYAGGFDDNYTINGSATSEVTTPNNASALHMNIVTGTLTVNTQMASGSGSLLVKTGAGTLVAGGASIYTSGPIIQQGVFRLANNTGLGTAAGGASVQAGSALELSQTTGGSPADITIGAEALALNGTGISDGGALRNHSGNNTYGGLITIGGGGARINSNVSTSLALTGGITTASGQNATFGGAGNTTVSATAITGAGGLIKDGAGTLTLAGANTYSGATTIYNGKLIVTTAGSGASSITIADTPGCILGVQVATDGGQWASTGNLTVGGTNSVIEIDYVTTVPTTSITQDPLKVANLTVSGIGTLKVLGDPTKFTAGSSYPLINFTGTGPDAADPYTGMKLSLPAEMTWHLKTVANHVVLVVESVKEGTVIILR